MAQSLKEYLAVNPCREFRPVPQYFATGDFLTYYWANDRPLAERIDDQLTVYRSIATHEMVGFKIKGVKHLLETAGEFGVTVDDGEVQLSFFFLWLGSKIEDIEKVRLYKELGKIASGVTLSKDLVSA